MKFQKSFITNEWARGAQRGKEKERKQNNYLAKKGGKKYERTKRGTRRCRRCCWSSCQRTNVDPVTRSFFNDPVTSSSVSQAQDTSCYALSLLQQFA